MTESDVTTAPLLVERRDDRVVATLNRPDKRNAIDQATIDALHALCEELEAEPRTLILVGAGGVFASGADIAQLRERRAADALAGINANAFVRVNEVPMPVIAAIDGWALGGGAELAFAADIRIATPDAKFGNPETGLGIIPAAGATWRRSGPSWRCLTTSRRRRCGPRCTSSATSPQPTWPPSSRTASTAGPRRSSRASAPARS